MNIASWIIFGVINAFVLDAIEPQGTGIKGELFMGVLGALTGGTFAYFLFGGEAVKFNIGIFSVIIFESIILLLFFFGRSFRRMT